jgi:hypothetical protein
MWPGIFMPRMTVPGNKALPDGAGTPPPAFGAVRGVAAAEIVPFHHAFKPRPLVMPMASTKSPCAKMPDR